VHARLDRLLLEWCGEKSPKDKPRALTRRHKASGRATTGKAVEAGAGLWGQQQSTFDPAHRACTHAAQVFAMRTASHLS